MKSWIKGGFIGIGVFVVFSIIILISGMPLLFFVLFIPGAIASYLFRDPTSDTFYLDGYYGFYLYSLITVIIFFLVGALIGLVVKKIKSKK